MIPTLSRNNPFDPLAPGGWWKGAVHFHSRGSDGHMEPDAIVAMLKQRGYDFMCLGDHWCVTVPTDPEGRMLIIPGCEIDTWTDDTPGNTHLMCIGVTRPPGNFRPAERPTHRELWETAKAISAFQVLNHPYWSTRSTEFLKSYDGLTAIEVYNHKSEVDNAMGYGEYPWHLLLNEGRRIDALAVDDAHGGPETFGHAWLMVRATDLTQAAIIAALQQGQFYSTRGPTIAAVTFSDDRMQVTCSPVRRVIVRGNQFFGKVFTAKPGEMLTRIDCPIALGEMEFARIELEDDAGLKAWSNPLWFANTQLNPPTAQRRCTID